MANHEKRIHPSYAHVAEAVHLLPQTLSALYNLKVCFRDGGEEFLAHDIRMMMERLEEIEDILLNGDKG